MIQAFRAIPQTVREWATWIQSIETQGAFTATLTGFGTNPTGTVLWCKVGRRVSLTANSAITGTSNATALTMTGLPQAICPENAKHVNTILVDNNTAVNGMANLSGTTITFYMGAPFSATGFTDPGVKGIAAGWQMSWLLDE